MHLRVGLVRLCDFVARVHDGGVVASAKMTADFLEAVACELSCQVHTYLARFGNALAPLLAL